MVSLSIEERDRLFTGTGPLSSFSTKIQLAYAMGIIGKKVRHDLDTIREMRNAMAHASKQINFETKEIVTLCRGLHVLRTIDKREDLTRAQDIFAESVRLLMIYLIGKFAPPHLVAAMPPKLRDLD
jgi:DNA-binding MltR family transcriptional regulator